MTRLIDADALKEYVGRVQLNSREKIFNLIDAQPTIGVVPMKRGTWRFVSCATSLRCQCSECLHWVDAGADKKYCPNCGADMRGEK